MSSEKTSETTNLAWEDLLCALSEEELERRIHRLDSYKSFVHNYGRYKKIRVQLFSLDQMLEDGYPFDSGEDLEDDMIAWQEVEAFEALLTPKQLDVLHNRAAGLSSREIAQESGYKNTGGVRYHTAQLRKRYGEYNPGR